MSCLIKIFFVLKLGAQFCFILSWTGVIFLSSIYFLVKSKSPYVPLYKENLHNRDSITSGIFGAIVIYAIFIVISSILWYRSATSRGIAQQSLDD